jgi:uncharacterized protein (DUF2062 family)
VNYQPNGWAKRGLSALALLFAIAIGARVAYGLLAPLLPALGVTVVLVAICAILFRGWRR